MRSLIVLGTMLLLAGSGAGWMETARAAGEGDSLRLITPANFPPPVYQFSGNPLTEAGFDLGRKLFYDPLLSRDGSIACSNCHQPFAAFAHLDHDVSHGVDLCFGKRNAPALFNLAWQKEFMWDGGVKHIEFSPLNALTNSCEMANSLDTIVARLSGQAEYRQAFLKAFGDGTINSQKILRALAQFTAMLVSANSRYDRYIRHEPGGSFSAVEERGYRLFLQYCSSCHREPLFTDLSFRNNGLDLYSEDPGRDTITANPADHGRFKIPSLRNVAFSPPYMHDGRLATLEEVLLHYSQGVKLNPNLDSLLRPAVPLTERDRHDLLAFLHTLSDSAFVNDPRFQP